jgi:hypothetical protein
MKRSKRNKKAYKKKTFWSYVFVLIILFAVSTGTSYLYFKDKFVFESDFIADIEARHDRAGNEAQKKGSLRLYKANEKNQSVRDSIVLRKDSLLVVAEDIIRKYVRSYKVKLLDLYMDKEGVIYIDFGDELKKNFKGDALEELRIIAGLYHGIKSTIPGFKAMKILIEGREAESFGGHIDISKPIGEEIAESI